MDNCREVYGNALAHALLLEIDGDILCRFGVNMKAYVIECREILQKQYGFLPYPFSEDNYWR